MVQPATWILEPTTLSLLVNKPDLTGRSLPEIVFGITRGQCSPFCVRHSIVGKTMSEYPNIVCKRRLNRIKDLSRLASHQARKPHKDSQYLWPLDNPLLEDF